MKHNTALPVTILSLALLLSVQSEARAAPESPPEAAVPGEYTGVPAHSEPWPRMRHKGMMHTGEARHGKGHGRGKHAGDHKGKGHGKHAQHDQVVKRLDMIEARLAKIEAMLESLIRR